MHREIMYVRPEDTLDKAIRMIKNYDFPQFPVLSDRREVVGTLNQAKLLVTATWNPKSIYRTRVEEVMDPPMPQISRETSIARLKPILEHYNAVIVVDRRRALGIITIYDVLKLL